MISDDEKVDLVNKTKTIFAEINKRTAPIHLLIM